MRRPRRYESLRDRPIVAFMTDFGLADAYVAVMKAAVVRHCPDARLIDVTHLVPPQDVLCGSITLERAVAGFPPGSVHLAVVDPGVGSDRRLTVARVRDQFVVCPDNGLVTWTWRMHGGVAHELTWRPETAPSHTFHGRDVLGPVAGMLASLVRPERVCGADPIEPVLLDVAPAADAARRGVVIHVDHYGNATTNVRESTVRAVDPRDVRVNGRSVGPLRRTYFDVTPGDPLALVASAGLLEIAVRDGSAARTLKLKVGDVVELRVDPETRRSTGRGRKKRPDRHPD